MAGDTNATADVFVRDRRAGLTTRVSVSSTGLQSDGFSGGHPTISGDGRFVAFSSSADNFVADDTNNADDVFVHDRMTGATIRASVSTAGTQGDRESSHPAISADGRCVAFTSVARNLVPVDTNGVKDIFVRDLATDTTARVSMSSGGQQGNGRCDLASVSADGRYIAFESDASDLVEGT